MATKVGFGLAIEKHRIYVLAVCAHCGAVVTMTSTQRRTLTSGNTLMYLDQNIRCCKKTDYTYMW